MEVIPHIEWIRRAHELQRKDGKSYSKPELDKKLNVKPNVEVTPKDKFKDGLTKWGKRTDKKSPKGKAQEQRRKQHERTSLNDAREEYELNQRLRREDQGIADLLGEKGTITEHEVNQDNADTVEEGEPGDYTRNIPLEGGEVKTKVEGKIRNDPRLKGRYTPGIGAENIRVHPKEVYDPRVLSDDLPGIDIDESQPLEPQLDALPYTNGNGNGETNGATTHLSAEAGLDNGNGNGNGMETVQQISDVANTAMNAYRAVNLIKKIPGFSIRALGAGLFGLGTSQRF